MDTERAKEILKWIEKNIDLISMTDCVKIVINVKENNVVGEVCLYPNTRRQIS